ncbi:MAG: hypothetical protein WCR27_08700 [Eubacteriales bacterium]
MTEHKIGEVFLDTENFEEPKRLKCVEDTKYINCGKCAYCGMYGCIIDYAEDCNEYFIETNEPLTISRLRLLNIFIVCLFSVYDLQTFFINKLKSIHHP